MCTTYCNSEIAFCLQQSSVEPTQAPSGFQFEEPRARIGWQRVRDANPLSIRSSGDVQRLQRFVGEVTSKADAKSIRLRTLLFTKTTAIPNSIL